MARPKKIGLDYFPLDVNYYSDVKVRKLMRNNGGGKALAVYTALLCSIYESGYYMLWDSDSPFMLSEKLGFEEGYLKEVTKYCVSVGLFDQELFCKHNVLTSRSIQARYFAAKRMSKGAPAMPYVYEEFVIAAKTPENGDYCSNNDTETGVFAAETRVFATKTQVIAAESTQSKVKKIKDKPLFLSSSTTSTRVREGDDKKKMLQEDIPEAVLVDDAVKELDGDREWLLSMQQRFGIDAKSIKGWLTSFVNDCKCRGTEVHQDKSDVMRHFNDWLNIKLKPPKNTNTRSPAVSKKKDYRRLWLQAHAELCRSVSADASASTFDLLGFESFSTDDSTGKDILTLTVPSNEVCDRLEEDVNIKRLTAVLSCYFGSFSLQYRINNNQNQ